MGKIGKEVISNNNFNEGSRSLIMGPRFAQILKLVYKHQHIMRNHKLKMTQTGQLTYPLYIKAFTSVSIFNP